MAMKTKSSVHHDGKHYPKDHIVDPSDKGFGALKAQGLLVDADEGKELQKVDPKAGAAPKAGVNKKIARPGDDKELQKVDPKAGAAPKAGVNKKIARPGDDKDDE